MPLDTFTVMCSFMMLMNCHTNLLMLRGNAFFFFYTRFPPTCRGFYLCHLVLKLPHNVTTIKLRAMVLPVRERKACY